MLATECTWSKTRSLETVVANMREMARLCADLDSLIPGLRFKVSKWGCWFTFYFINRKLSFYWFGSSQLQTEENLASIWVIQEYDWCSLYRVTFYDHRRKYICCHSGLKKPEVKLFNLDAPSNCKNITVTLKRNFMAKIWFARYWTRINWWYFLHALDVRIPSRGVSGTTTWNPWILRASLRVTRGASVCVRSSTWNGDQ